ncbi:excalibur calcium-binding domain-containing protein [Streptomyces rectiviolaceus]
MGLLGRIVAAVVAVAVGLLVLGAILSSCGHGADEPQAPVTTSASPTPSPSLSSPTPAEPSPSLSESVTPPPRPAETATETEAPEPPPSPESSAAPDVYYENCAEARAAGAAPLIAGEPGYRPELDRNLDGVACESP